MKQIQIHYNVSSYCCCSVIATLVIAFVSYFYQITFPIAFVKKNYTQNLFCYIFPKLTSELALNRLDDRFYFVLVTEQMINSELQPLPCCLTERELISPLPFFSSLVSWLAVLNLKERCLLSSVSPRIFC